MKSTLTDLTKRLITFESTVDNKIEIDSCLDFCRDYLTRSGLEVRIIESNNTKSLIAANKIKDNNTYKYLLNGHLDVVPGPKKAFVPLVKQGRLYGRGSADMKGAVASMMLLMENKKIQSRDTCLMLTTDEEIGGDDGVGYLVDNLGYRSECVILPDGGNNFYLTMGQKGISHIRLFTKGKSAHGSRPWNGSNAITKLLDAYAELEMKFNQAKKEKDWKDSINLGKIKGGEATNSVAEEAEMYIDLRFASNQSKDTLIKLLSRFKNEMGIEHEVLVNGDVFQNDPKNSYLKLAKKIAKNHGVDLKDKRTTTASDGRYFSAKKIPVIMFNPICSEGHIDNEWIEIESLEKHHAITRDFLLN